MKERARLAVLVPLACVVLFAGCGGSGASNRRETVPHEAGSRSYAEGLRRMNAIQAQGNHLAKELQHLELLAMEAKALGETQREENAEQLARLELRKLRALNREDAAILSEARERK